MWDAAGRKIAQADTVFLSHRSVRSQGSCCCVRRSAVVLSTCSALGSPRCQRANSSAMSVPQVGQDCGLTWCCLDWSDVPAVGLLSSSQSSDYWFDV